MSNRENCNVPPADPSEWEMAVLAEIEARYGDSLDNLSTNGLASLEHGQKEYHGTRTQGA